MKKLRPKKVVVLKLSKMIIIIIKKLLMKISKMTI